MGFARELNDFDAVIVPCQDERIFSCQLYPAYMADLTGDGEVVEGSHL